MDKPIQKTLGYYNFYDVMKYMKFSQEFTDYLLNYGHVSFDSYFMVDVEESLKQSLYKQEFLALSKEFPTPQLYFFTQW